LKNRLLRFAQFRSFENFLTLIIPKAFGLIANVASSLLVVRSLSVEDVGAYTLIVGYYMLMLMLSDLGINQTVLRYAAKVASHEEEHSALMNWGVRLKFISLCSFVLLFFLLAPVVAQLWGSTSLAWLMQIALLTGFASSMLAMPIVYFQSKQTFKQAGFLIAMQSLFNLLPLLYLQVSGTWSLVAVVISGVVSSVLILIVGLMMMPKKTYWNLDTFKACIAEPKRFVLMPFKREFSSDTEFLSPTRYLLFIMPAGLLFALASRIDIWLMGYFLTKPEIGVYGMAQRIALPLVVMQESVDGTISPAASAIKAREQVGSFLKASLKTVVGVGAVGLVYALFVPQVIPFLFGEAYQSGIWLTSLLCVRFIVAILASPFTWLAYNFDYAKVQWAVRVVQLLAIVALNLLLFSSWGTFAPATAWIMFELIGITSAAGFLFFSFRRQTDSILK
jgi:O-antigen/teichoic acid export membrane protein